MKRTALDQAIKMGRILEMYYDGDSSNQSAEVVSRIEGEEEAESAGSDTLAKFRIGKVPHTMGKGPPHLIFKLHILSVFL
jgi:hypothetical protein